MTSPPPTDPGDRPDLTGLHEVLSRLRVEPALVERFHHDPTAVCVEHELPPEVLVAAAALDLPRLIEMGTNPYLLFFAALELGIPRPDYYASLEGDARRG